MFFFQKIRAFCLLTMTLKKLEEIDRRYLAFKVLVKEDK